MTMRDRITPFLWGAIAGVSLLMFLGDHTTDAAYLATARNRLVHVCAGNTEYRSRLPVLCMGDTVLPEPQPEDIF